MTAIDIEATKSSAAEKAKQLPQPKGYRLLCMVPSVEETFAGGIVKADETKRVEEQTTVVLFVVDMGGMAYKDPIRFPDGPWCKKGDFVLTRAYSGTRIRIHGTEWRLINDDSVEAVVQDPRGISRAG
jgi:co-chaperonin GroES (HSP10)